MEKKIKLVTDTIDYADIERLVKWLKTKPRLTKGEVTLELEKRFADWLGTRYSVFVNSGSSANLLMIWTLMELGYLKRGDKIFIPSVAWATDLAPVLQLGLEPVLVDANLYDLSIDLDHFTSLIEQHRATGLPRALLLVSVLGLVPDMKIITKFCDKNNIILLEDNCESMGSTFYDQNFGNKNLGTFGLVSSFSTYFGHHISTIEGGFVVTDNERIYNYLLAIRSHGWDRDMNDFWKKRHQATWEVNDFNRLYTFYYAGFNIRSTDLQAYIGLGQLDKLDDIIDKRNKNYFLYRKYLKDELWKPADFQDRFVSNFAYPIILEDFIHRDHYVKILQDAGVEVRPIICGNLGTQPFYVKRFGKLQLPNVTKINAGGFYVPNHPALEENEIEYICNILNNF